jgi:hypothetical protein
VQVPREAYEADQAELARLRVGKAA